MHRVLIVEDNPITRKVMRMTLEGAGYSVAEARTGDEAVAAAEGEKPDLVLQDLLLPGMPTEELVRHLRSLPGNAALPILACSGFLSRIEEARAREVGFSGYLVKPVAPSRLLATVQAYLKPG